MSFLFDTLVLPTCNQTTFMSSALLEMSLFSFVNNKMYNFFLYLNNFLYLYLLHFYRALSIVNFCINCNRCWRFDIGFFFFHCFLLFLICLSLLFRHKWLHSVLTHQWSGKQLQFDRERFGFLLFRAGRFILLFCLFLS